MASVLDVFHLPPLTGDVLAEVVRKKKSTSGGLDGSGWRELKALPLPWFDGLARILRLVEETGVWPDGFAMIPKVWWGCHSFRSEAFLCSACGLQSLGIGKDDAA